MMALEWLEVGFDDVDAVQAVDQVDEARDRLWSRRSTMGSAGLRPAWARATMIERPQQPDLLLCLKQFNQHQPVIGDVVRPKQGLSPNGSESVWRFVPHLGHKMCHIFGCRSEILQ